MNSPWIDIAIGVAFVFFVFSVVVSAVNELINWIGQVRSKQLWQALHHLTSADAGFSDRPDTQIKSRVFRFLYGLRDTFFRVPTGRVDHRPEVRLSGDLTGSAEFLSMLRSTAALRSLETAIGGRTSIRHIPPETFAAAFQEIGLRGDGELQRIVEGLHPLSPLRRHVDDLTLLVSSNAIAFRDHMATWFDDQMAELSRRYRKDVRRVMFAIGFGVAVIANLSAIHVVASAQRDSDLRQALVANATAVAGSGGVDATCATATGATGGSAKLQCLRDEIAKARALRVTTDWNLDGPCRNGKTCSSWFGRAIDVVPSAFDMIFHRPLAAIGRLIGWILSAIALSFGGAFWFDILRRLVGYRAQQGRAR
jgi:hypothetical protein